MLAYLYLGTLGGNGTRRERLLAWGLALLYGITDEIHQSFVPGRHPSAVDIVVDGIGAALAVLRGISRFRPLR